VGDIATIESGSGPAVLLIHGLNGFKEGWGPLPEALADAGLRPVAIDLPGSGATPRLAHRTSPSSLARALDPLISELAPVALVGHSLGTQVAMIAAAARPERVRALALLAPWVLPRPRRFPPADVSDVLQVPVLGRLAARVAIARIRRSPARRRDAFLTAVADPGGLSRDPRMAALLEEAADRLLAADLRAMADWAAGALAFDARPLAASIPQPALVACGTLDRITRPPGAHVLADALPAGRILSVPDAGHFPHLERPGVVIPQIVEQVA
jgi:pimeloyl-ACP methyl ester carboxylesterase